MITDGVGWPIGKRWAEGAVSGGWSPRCFKADLGKVGLVLKELAIGCQREERPGVAVHVVFEVKYFGEARARCFMFRP